MSSRLLLNWSSCEVSHIFWRWGCSAAPFRTRPTVLSLILINNPARCCTNKGLDQCVTGTPTSLGGRHASAMMSATWVAEKERSAVPHVGRPLTAMLDLSRRIVSSSETPCDHTRLRPVRYEPNQRHRPGAASLVPAPRPVALWCPRGEELRTLPGALLSTTAVGSLDRGEKR